MAVSDPTLKELKGHLIKLIKSNEVITDDSLDLLSLCDCLERIFSRGFHPQNYILGLAKRYDCWLLFQHLATISDIPYGFQSSVELAQKCRKLKTYQGRLRLCLRSLLLKKCLHVPVQQLIDNPALRQTFYETYSLLGNEILCEIFLSLCVTMKSLNFKLELSNARFLDETWLLPNIAHITLVPCSELGISVVFAEDKAVIMQVLDSSVALESEGFSVGDILDEINGVIIHDSQQGVLRSIVKRAHGSPVTAVVIKAHLSDSLYPPLVPLLKTVGLDPAFILHGEMPPSAESAPSITYLGYELTPGTDVKQIHASIVRMLNTPLEQSNTAVHLECQELGVRVRRTDDSSLLYSHQYMQITSCGRTVHNPRYFGYIVENKDRKEFECHMFYCPVLETTDSILQSIGQGFKRTHYAV
ncbi:hypothetical protein M8J75_008580 [Diaphorina citri]|nr:hypothetical protein M8J75_008580 [Diaphorina citri]